jgi:CheY-like chemotaxis protein
METVLVVDDYSCLREVIVDFISSCTTFRVQEASNGLEAIEIMETGKPDLILMDVQMPVMDGLEATGAIKGKWPNVVVITYSGDCNPETARLARNAGSSLHVAKPLDLRQLVESMEQLLAVKV